MAAEDHGPEIVGVTWLLCILSGIFLGLRLYAKLSRHKGLWWDDHILIVSWALLFIEATVTQVGQCLGFGKHVHDIPEQNLIIILVGIAAVGTISSFASTLSKISFGVTLLRLTQGPARTFVWFAIITLFLVMLPSATLQWIPSVSVVTSSNYGFFNAAWCAVMDFALALLPWKMLWGLQMKKREKVGVGIAMSLGLFAGVCAIIKGVFIVQLRKGDFSYNGKDVTIWTAVETATAIIGASVPVLRVLLKETVSSHSHSLTQKTTGTRTISTSKSIRLSRVTSRDHNLELGINTTSVEAVPVPGELKGGGWTRLEPVIEEDGSTWSGKSVYREDGEEHEERTGSGVQILRAHSVRVEYAQRSGSERGKRWDG